MNYLDLNKKDFKYLLNRELNRYGVNTVSRFLNREFYNIGKTLWYIRMIGYCTDHSKGNIIDKIKLNWLYYRYNHYFAKTRIAIHPHSCDWGIKIWHSGDIIINDKARIGKNLTIYPGCIIGHTEEDEVPTIGDNCFMGAGSKIFGKIIIGDNVTIAPNSVVTKDIPSNCIVSGIPAKIISNKSIKYSWNK